MIKYRQLENDEEIYSDDYIIVGTEYQQCGKTYYRKTPSDFPGMVFYRKSYDSEIFGSKFD